MANTFTSIRSKVVGVFDSTGASDAITVDSGFLVDLSIIDGGSFGGTIQLQAWYTPGGTGQWVTIESYTDADLPVIKTIRSGNLRRYRLNCSAVSAGEADFEMSAGNRE